MYTNADSGSEVTAADLMDRIYRHQRHLYDATRKYYLLGRDRLIAELAPPQGGCVLEIGCGTGRNLILVGRRYPDARCFGIDISGEMLTSTATALARAGLASRVRVARADATVFDPAALFGVDRFDRIFMSYTLSMIPDWPAALHRAVALLAAGGALYVVDFGGQERLPAAFRNGLRRWLSLFHVAPRDDLETALLSQAASAGAALAFARPFRGYAQYAVLRAPSAPFPKCVIPSSTL